MRRHSFLKLMQTLLLLLLLLLSNPKTLAQIQKPITDVLGSAAAALPLQDLLTFADQRLATAYPIIQRFKNLITSDPFNVTATWTGPDICKYKGFFCDSPPNNHSAIAVASIDFNGFHLSSPTLAGFLDFLPDLALFHANSNSFAGAIPATIARLPYLYELDLSNNKFSGPFPAAVLAMDSLSFLDIRFNLFSGAVPPELFTKNLDLLFLNNNNFMTKLPDILDSINAHVLYLTLANNKLFGPIPRTIADSLAGLSEILLLNNMLSGCLPYELGLLKDAVVFDAGNNNLTGPLPLSLGCLEKLEVLNLAGNFLYGGVPEPLCELGRLSNLSLSDNYFTEIGSGCRRLVESGVVDVRRNCIGGQPWQRSVAECAAFMARPKYCPYMDTYSQIPCRLPASTHLAPSPAS